MEDLDEITISRAAHGDHAAFKRYYDHYAPFVWRVAFKTVNGNHDTAQRITQDTFVKANAHLKRFRSQSKMSTWLYGITFRTALDHLRSQKRHAEKHVPIESEYSLSVKEPQIDEKSCIDLILSSLEPSERFLLTAREVDGLSFEELEIITGQSGGSLRTALSRLKKRLQEKFSHACS